MLLFISFLVLAVVAWPLALLALVLYPLVWVLSIPFRLVGISVRSSVRTARGHRSASRTCTRRFQRCVKIERQASGYPKVGCQMRLLPDPSRDHPRNRQASFEPRSGRFRCRQRGKQWRRSLADHLVSVSFDAIYTSPMARCRETASRGRFADEASAQSPTRLSRSRLRDVAGTPALSVYKLKAWQEPNDRSFAVSVS